MVSLDGKGTAVPAADDFYAQRQTAEEDSRLVGIVRTVTATLTRSHARPVIDVMSIPASTGEMGCFERALDARMAAYDRNDMFRLVTYDAGACSKDNAQAARDRGLHDLLAIKSTPPSLYDEAVRWLGALALAQAAASSSDLDHGNTVVRRLYIGEAVAAPDGWNHLRTVLRVEIETFDTSGTRVAHENRYFVSSLPRSRLTDPQWLLVVRRHWGVETSHQILDTVFAEDASSPQFQAFAPTRSSTDPPRPQASATAPALALVLVRRRRPPPLPPPPSPPPTLPTGGGGHARRQDLRSRVRPRRRALRVARGDRTGFRRADGAGGCGLRQRSAIAHRDVSAASDA